jgi:hypothetical protein
LQVLKCGAGERRRRSVLPKNEELLQRVKEERNILHPIYRRKASVIFHIFRRNYLLRHVIEGKIEGRMVVTGRQERRSKQILDYLQETRRCWKLKDEALDHTLWRTRFGCAFGPVVRRSK